MIIDAAVREDIPALRRLWKEAFGDTDAFLDNFFSTGFCSDRCRIAKEDGALLGALYWFEFQWGEKRLAYLYAVATAKAFQGQKICSRLMEDTHKHLLSLGFSGTVLVPGSASLFDFYGKLGYVRFGGICELSATAGATPVSLRKIPAADYMEERKEYLPSGSILPVEETLPFLNSLLSFYEGDGWLLAAAEEAGCLAGKEFLGDIAQLPGILCGLGMEKGSFRTPGAEKPFAMFHSFGGAENAPDYFAFALD